MTFDMTTLSVLLVFIFSLFFLWKKKAPQMPFLAVSSKSFLLEKKSVQSVLCAIAPYFFWLALASIALSLSDPKSRQVQESKETKKESYPRSGNALYFLIDQSGSMAEQVVGQEVDQELQKETKLTLAKEAVQNYLNQAGDNLIGLVAFARAAKTLSPLTLDRGQIEALLESLRPITQERLNGTAIGYAIFKTVNTIVATKYFAERQKEKQRPAYSIENQAIVVITDGLQAPHPDDRMHPFRYMPVQDALRYAAYNNVRVYFIGVDPIFMRSDVQDEVAELKQTINKTGGKLFLMSPEYALSEIFSEIGAFEKSWLLPLEIKKAEYSYKSQSFIFVTFALLFLLCALLIETLFAKRVP